MAAQAGLLNSPFGGALSAISRETAVRKVRFRRAGDRFDLYAFSHYSLNAPNFPHPGGPRFKNRLGPRGAVRKVRQVRKASLGAIRDPAPRTHLRPGTCLETTPGNSGR